MKPTHAQLVNLLREIVWASPQVLPELIERARQVLCLRDDATSAPAVTGEAAEHAETLRELANNFGSGNPTFNGFKAGRDYNRQRAYAACRAGAEALAAPPAAGAPPALVAQLEAAFDLGWQAHKEYLNAPRPDFSTRSSRRDAALAPMLAALGSPAPAPVAPPAEDHVVGYTPDGTPLMKVVNVNAAGNFDVGVYAMPQLKREPAPPAGVPECPAGQHSYRRNAPPQPGDVCFVCRKSIWMPAPPAVAGGDAPEIQVGDRVKLAGFGWVEVPDDRTARVLRGNDGVDEIERNGVVIWRRQGVQ